MISKPFIKTISIILFLALTISLSGQRKELMFNHFMADDGLSHNSVYTINQDTIGFIWVGTRSGLNRFDGNNFKIYDVNQGLMDVYINTIFRDSDGNMWIGTKEGGVSRYNYETDDFKTWMYPEEDQNSLRNNNILSIAEDNKGVKWIGTHGGKLFRFSSENELLEELELVGENNKPTTLNRINKIVFDSDSTAWIGTFHGLYRLSFRPDKSTNVCYVEQAFDLWVTSIYIDPYDKLWIGTNSGVVIFEQHQQEYKVFNTSNSDISNNMVTDIEPMPDGTLVIATDGGGINILNTSTAEFEAYLSDPNNPYSLSNNSVYDVFLDREQSLWTGNYIGGLNYFYPEEWKFNLVRHKLNRPNSLSDNHVRTLHEDKAGNIWLGTLGGLNLYNKESGDFSNYIFDESSGNSLSSNAILSIYDLDENHLWIGTFGGGLNIFEKNSHSFSKFSHSDDLNNSLEKSSIYQIIDTENDKTILASLGGIYVLDKKSGQLKRYTSSNSKLSSNTVKALCKDHKGNIWLGTNFGLNRFDPRDETFKVYTHSNTISNSLSNNRILSIYESNDKLIWIGTEGGGVSIFNPENETFQSISTNEGLPDNVINAVVQDHNGSYWLSSNKGLIRYEYNEELISVYTVADGLQANEFYQNACLLTSDGTIYFGGPNGFNSLNPEELKTNAAPQVVFTDVHVSGKIVREYNENSPVKKQIYLSETIKFPYHTDFEFHFTVPGTPNSNRFLFSYFLEGEGEAWSEFQKANFVNYSHLRSGKYVLWVRAINNDGIVSDKPASINIKILPPWWKTWWVFIIYAFTLGGLLTILLKLNNSKLRAHHALQIEITEKKQLKELNLLKLRFFTDISHEFKTPLTLILGHLENIKDTDQKNKTHSVIESNAKRLLSLINQLMEFRKAESGLMKLNAAKGNIISLITSIVKSFSDLALRKNISLEIIKPEIIPDIWFDSEKMEKILFNLLSNAFKYTEEEGKVEIELKIIENIEGKFRREKTKYLQINIRDTGIGIPKEELALIFDRFYHSQSRSTPTSNTTDSSSGIGLAFTKKLVELHHGKIFVKSKIDQGAEFIFELPLGKVHLSDKEIKEDDQYHLRLDYSNISTAEEIPKLEDAHDIIIDRSKPIMLVVDDNQSVRQMLSEKFQNTYTVITAEDGEVGIKKARNYLPDIVISDIMMPNIDGFELCHLLKTNMITSHLPVILLTAKSDDEDQIHGFTKGADAYISKPYNPDLLKATVENLLNSRKLLRDKYIDQTNNISSELIENKLDEEFLQKLVETIEDEKFSENMDVSTLCSELAMSRSVLYRKVKMLTDKSIQEFVRIVKLQKASRLLQTTKLPISEIAYVSGFSNTKHFSTAFKKLFSKTPSQYRTSSSNS